MKKQIDQIRGQSRCPNCGGIQPMEASFCASCGTKLPKPEPVDPSLFEDEEEEARPEQAPEPERPVSEASAENGAQIIWPEAPAGESAEGPGEPEQAANDPEEADEKQE